MKNYLSLCIAMLKKCLQCGKEFNAGMSRIKCCSVDCASKLRTKYKDKICPTCWKVFHPLNVTHKFCSPKCRLKWIDYECVCDICETSFFSKVPYSKYCCDECKKEWMRRRHKKIKCERCWMEFHPWHKWAKYCSNKCKRESKKTIQERICPICGGVFIPIADARIYCSKECYSIAQSEHWKELTKEDQRKIVAKMQEWNKKVISSENIKYANYLEKSWYQVSFEFHLWNYYYDLKVWDVLIEINPFAYHSSNRAPGDAEPKPPMYHYNKAKYAIECWYKIIKYRPNWMSKDELLYILQNLKITELWEIKIHRYCNKTNDHIIGDWYNEEEMLANWYVKIYDWWEKYIFNSTNLN